MANIFLLAQARYRPLSQIEIDKSWATLRGCECVDCADVRLGWWWECRCESLAPVVALEVVPEDNGTPGANVGRFPLLEPCGEEFKRPSPVGFCVVREGTFNDDSRFELPVAAGLFETLDVEDEGVLLLDPSPSDHCHSSSGTFQDRCDSSPGELVPSFLSLSSCSKYAFASSLAEIASWIRPSPCRESSSSSSSERRSSWLDNWRFRASTSCLGSTTHLLMLVQFCSNGYEQKLCKWSRGGHRLCS